MEYACSGTPGSSRRLAWPVLGCLSKQIKGVRALKDDGGGFLCPPPGCGSSNWTGRMGNGLKAFRMFPDARHTFQDIKVPYHLHISHSLKKTFL